MAERGSIVMDIRAQVSGYEQSLRKLQAEFAKVDPGSQIGKSLTKAIQDAENQLKGLNKNLTPRVSSDTQIDNTIQKVNNLGEAVQRISGLMRQVTTTDINFDAADSSIAGLVQQLQQLQTQLEETVTISFRNTISNTDSLNDAFKKLKIDITGKTRAEIFDELTKKSGEAAKAVLQAQKAADQAKTALTNSQNNLTLAENNPLLNKDVLIANFNQVGEEYKNLIANLQSELRDGLKSLSDINDTDREKIIAAFTGGLTQDNLKEHLEQLRESVQQQLKTTMNSTDLFKMILPTFGQQGRIPSIVKSFKDSGLLPTQDELEQLRDALIIKLQGISRDLSPTGTGTLINLASAFNFDSFVKELEDQVDKAQPKLVGKIMQLKQAVDEALKTSTGADQNLNTATADVTNIQNLINELYQVIQTLMAANNELSQKIAVVEGEIGNKQSAAAENLHQIAEQTALTAREFELSSNEIQKYKDQLNQVHEKEQLVGRIEGVVQRWFSIYAAVRMVGNAIRSVVSTLKELDATITEIAIVTNMTQKDLWNQMSDYTAMAQKYAASISGVYKVSQLYYQQGLQTKEVMELTEQTLKMARISGLDYAEATDYMTNAVRSFKMEMSEAQTVVDVYSAIAAKSATNVTELAEAMSKTASSAESVGSSFENTTAMMAVMIEATRESATNIGSAMKSIISRYGEMKANPSKLIDSEGEAISLNKVDTALQSVGISIHDVNGQFRDFDEVIMELAESWNTIDKNTQRYIATIMAGNRQQSRFLALVSSYDRLKELSAEAANSEDAAQLQYLKTLDSIDAKTQQLQTSMQNLYVDSGLEKFYGFLIDAGKSIVDTFNNMPKLFDLPILAIGKFGVAFWGIARIVTAVAKSIKTKLLTEQKVIESNITLISLQEQNKRVQNEIDSCNRIIQAETSSVEEARAAYIKQTEAFKEQAKIREDIAKEEAMIETNSKLAKSDMLASLRKSFTREGGYMGQTMLGLGLSSIGSSIAANSQKSSVGAWAGSAMSVVGSTLTGVAMLGAINPILGGVVGAVTGLIQVLPNVIVSEEERIKQLQEEAEEAKNIYIQKKSDTQNLATQIEQLRKLEKARYDSKEAEEEYYQVANQMAETYPGLIKSMDEAGNVVIDLNAAEIQLINTRQESIKAAKDAAKKAVKSADKDEQESKKKQGASGNLYLQISRQMGANSLYKPDFLYGNYKAYQRIQKENTTFSSLNEQQEYFKKQYLQQSLPAIDGGSFRSSESINLEDWKNFIQYMIENPDAIYTGTNAAMNISTLINEAGKYVQNEVNAQYKSDISAQVKRSGIATIASTYFQGITDNFLSEIPNIMSIITTQAEIQMQDSYGEDGITTKEYDTFIDEELEVYLAKYQREWNEFWNKTLDTQGKKDVFVGLLKQTSVLSQGQFNNYLTSTGLSPEMQASIIEDAYKNAYSIEDFKNRYTPEIVENVTQIQNTMLNAADKWISNLGSSELQSVNEFYDNLNALTTSRKIDDTKQLDILNKYLSIGEALNSADDTIREQLEAVWYNWDGTLTGLYEVQEKLTELGFEDNSNLIGDLIEILPVNITTEFELLTSKLSSGLEDFEKALSSAAKGMDYNDASELAAKMGESLDSFNFIDGKYFFKNAEDIRNAYVKYNKELLDELKNRILVQAESEDIDASFDELLQFSKEDESNSLSNELKAELKSYQEFIHLSDEYVEYQVNAWRIQNNSLKEVLKSIDKSLDDEQVNALVQQAMNGDFSGFMSNEYLAPYISIISDTIKNITSEVFSAATESIKAGRKVNIAVTDANREILQELSEQGFVEYNDELSVALIQVTKDNIDEYIKFIGAKVKNPTEQAQYIQQAWNAVYDTNVIDAFTEFTSSTTVTRETADKFVIALGGTAKHTTNLMKEWGYKLNKATGDFEATTNSIEELQKKLDDLENGSIEQRNKIQAQIDKLGAQQQLDLSSALKDVISNYQSVTIEQREALANALGEDYNNISQFFNDNRNGTYKFDIAGLQEYLNNSEIVVSDATYDLLQELIGNVVDNYLESITKAIGYATSGTTNYADVRKFLSDYEAEGWDFEWNNILGAWILSGNDLIAYINQKAQELKQQNPNLSNNEIDQWINTQYNNIRDALDITSYLSAEDRGENSKARETLKYQIENIKALSEEFTEQTTEEIINNLNIGGERAAETLKKLKPNASSEEIQNAYRAVIDDQLNALEAISSLTAGQIIATNGELYKALKTLDMVDDNGVIKDTFNMVAAYTQIYEAMKKTAGKTQSDLNKAYADVLTAREQQEIDAIEAMSNAMGMTYYQLGEILGKQGKDLEDFMKNRAANLGIEQIGNGKIRLNDFNAFAQEMGWKYGSEEYLSAFKAYNDSLVELNRQTEKSILEEVKNIISANRGDKVNLTYLIDTLGAGAEQILNKQLQEYGASIKNGILTISESADLIGISQTIQNAAENSGKLMEEELAEITDSITEAINSYSELLIKGITGNLTNADLQKLMKDSGLQSVTYEKTADGLRLTQEYLIRLYSAMDAGVNKIKVFDELNKYLQENNKNYKTASANLARINELNKLRIEEAKKLQDTSDAISETDRQISQNRLKQYTQELAVAEKIAAIRATTEDSSYSFMDQNMPGGFQNPINYWESWGKAMKSIQEAGENGYIGIQDYYNMITHIQDLAVQTGKDMKFMGMTISQDGTSAAELIENGFKAMTLDVESGNTVLSLDKLSAELGKAGFDFKAGAEGFDENIQDGIHEFAKSQVKMLDGMIKFVETIAAMEKLRDLDIEGNGIDFNDIFSTSFYEPGKGVTWNYTEQYQEVAQALLESGKDLEGITVAGYTLKQILEDAKNGIKDITIENDSLVALLQALYSTSISQNYDENDIYNSILETFQINGISGELSIGQQKVYIDSSSGIILEFSDENNHWFYNGKDLGDDPQEALKQALAMRTEELENLGVEVPEAIKVEDKAVEQPIHNTFVLSVSQVDAYAKDANVNFVEKPENPGSVSSLDATTENANITNIGSVSWDSNGTISNKDLGTITSSDIVSALSQLGINNVGQLIWALGGVTTPTGFNGNAPLNANNICAVLAALDINDVNTLSWALGQQLTGQFTESMPATLSAMLQTLSILGANDITPSKLFLTLLSLLPLYLEATLHGQASGANVDLSDEAQKQAKTTAVDNLKTALQGLNPLQGERAEGKYDAAKVGLNKGATVVDNTIPDINLQLFREKHGNGEYKLEKDASGKWQKVEVGADQDQVVDETPTVIDEKTNKGQYILADAIANFASLIIGITPATSNGNGTTSGGVNAEKVKEALDKYKESLKTADQNGALEVLFATLGIDINDTTPKSQGALKEFLTNASLEEKKLFVNFATMLLGWTGKTYSGNGDPLADGEGTGDIKQDDSLTSAIQKISVMDNKALSVFFATILAAVTTDTATWGENEEEKVETALSALGFTNEEIKAIFTTINASLGNAEGQTSPQINGMTDVESSVKELLIGKEVPGNVIKGVIETIQAVLGQTINAGKKLTQDDITTLQDALSSYDLTNEQINATINTINAILAGEGEEVDTKDKKKKQQALETLLKNDLKLSEETIEAIVKYIETSTTNAQLSQEGNDAEDLRNKVIELLGGENGAISIGTIDAIIAGYNLTVGDEPNSNDKKYYDEKGIFKNILFEEDTELWQNNKAAWNKYLNDTFSTGNIEKLDLVIAAINELSGNAISDGQFNFGSQEGQAILAKLGLSWKDGELTTTFNDSPVIDLGTKEGHVKLSQIQIDDTQPITTELDEEAQVVKINFVGTDGQPYVAKVPAAAFIDQVDNSCVDGQGRLTKLGDLSVDILTFLSDLQKGAWDAWRENNIPNEVPIKMVFEGSIPEYQEIEQLQEYGRRAVYGTNYSDEALLKAFIHQLNNASDLEEFYKIFDLDNTWEQYAVGLFKKSLDDYSAADFYEELLRRYQHTHPNYESPYAKEENTGGGQYEAIMANQQEEAEVNEKIAKLIQSYEESSDDKQKYKIATELYEKVNNLSELYEKLGITSQDLAKLIVNAGHIEGIAEGHAEGSYGQLTEDFLREENDAVNLLSDAIEELKNEAEIDIDVDLDNATSQVDQFRQNIRNNPETLVINAQVNSSENGVGSAKGNVALAQGTLMGELGPELYVTNGRYFVAGQNGAEFVNLPKDAIVFNHLQTQKLLNNGSSSRGKPITNEKNAVSFAKGGPAQASASSTLAALKHLKAQWEAIANASLQDLASTAGGGGGGGNDNLAIFIKDVERWYNWLQKIARLEEQITYQEQLRSKIQSDFAANGKIYYNSQKQSLKALEEQAATASSLAMSQEEFYKKRMRDLENSPFARFYEFDEFDQIKYKSSGFTELSQLLSTNDQGLPNYTAEQQYNWLIAAGYTDFMKYDSSGQEIKMEDDAQTFYSNSVQAFFDRLDAEKEELQGLHDSIEEQKKAVLEKIEKMNELIKEMRDNQKDVENSVLKAIEDSRKREIDELSKQKDAIAESANKLVDGLSNSLEKERKLYENNQADNELNRLRRQLSILQRSGGSVTEIASLQNQIDEQSRDQYFDKQQEQIDAVKEASDKQIERMDTQIELMNETLEYQKANGLLWGQVYEVMSGNAQEIAAFVSGNDSSFWASSPLASTEDVNDLIFKAEKWVEFRDDVEGIYDTLNAQWGIFQGSMREEFGSGWDAVSDENKAAMKQIFDAKLAETGDYNEAAAAARQSIIYQDLKKQQEANTKPLNINNTNQNAQNDKGLYQVNYVIYGYDDRGIPITFKGSGVGETPEIAKSVAAWYANQRLQNKGVMKSLDYVDYSDVEKIYKNGGLIDYTGPAWVDGTKQRPESIWDADTTKLLRDNLFNTNKLNLLSSFWDTLQGYETAANHSYSNNSESLVIENAVVNMNVASIANDYDARRAGEQAMEEMLKIARKTKVSSFS